MLNKLHLPSHLGMTAMYKKSELKYAGFRREKIYEIVSNCITCKKHVPPARIAPITPIISTFGWDIVQMDCIDMRDYSSFNDGFNWILNILDSFSKFLFSLL
ncbi:hypothetical protein H311_00947 [Anncaliia algerae PRA109]|nr:hypothetical protein H311_00947 [Anncaliia algerae PRA109]